MSLSVITEAGSARDAVSEARKRGLKVGLVPTMGALHEGHLSLIRAARKETGFLAVSIFVNPTQFGPTEDYDEYPRDLDRDLELCRAEGVDLVFAPQPDMMYPKEHATYIVQERYTEHLCGLSRPGFFHGVCTVVIKLFNIIAPDIAYFGQKDYQQAVVIKRTVADLNMPVEIRILPTVREADGLAVSSRNNYLSQEERLQATCLHRALTCAQELLASGGKGGAELKAAMKEEVLKAPSARVDYIAVVDPDSLDDVREVRGRAVAALAVWIGGTRLIDNMMLVAPAKE